MSSADDYRTNAEDCLRMANTATEDRDRPLWATMAQSWLRLAQHAERTVPTAVRTNIAGDHVECVTLAPEQSADNEGPASTIDAAETTTVPSGAAH